jgi:hypothetical protein
MSCRIPKQSIKKFFNCKRGKAEDKSRPKEAEERQRSTAGAPQERHRDV